MAELRGKHRLVAYGRFGLLSLSKARAITLVDIDWSADLSTFNFRKDVYIPVVPELKRYERRIRWAKALHRLGRRLKQDFGIKVLKIEFDVL